MPDDLRAGHFLLYAGGGFAFIPDALLPPATLPGSPLTNVALGGGGQLQLGVGLNRFLVLGLDGAFGRAAFASDRCDGCSVTTVGVGLGLAFHPSQAFAFDPWVRYGFGYRHTSSDLDISPDIPIGVIGSTTESAFDFAKLSIGGDFYPDPLFGFGPYLELDLGVNRLDDSPQVYGNLQLGLRVAFDPMRGGTVIAPGSPEVFRPSVALRTVDNGSQDLPGSGTQ